MSKKKKRRWIRIERRKTPKGTYSRIFIGRWVIFCKNNPPFKRYKDVSHYHIGDRFKFVVRPKQLRGLWIKWKGKYERFGKVAKEIIKELSAKFRKGRS